MPVSNTNTNPRTLNMEHYFPCAFIRLYVLFHRCLDIDNCGSALLDGMNVKNAFGKKGESW